jgi:fructose-bisphosphate aldolase class I
MLAPSGPQAKEHRVNTLQAEKIGEGHGFIAALDQSGGSTPKALRDYGVLESAYSTEDEMFDLMHAMRVRIMKSPVFGGDRVLGAILFEQTMDRTVDGVGTAEFLWDTKQVVPFLKIDKGLADEVDGAQVMKPNPGLEQLLSRAVTKGVFGTKERSVIKLANQAGVDAVLDQQFEVAAQVIAAGLVPIIEPEVDINSPEKAAAEALLRTGILDRLAGASSQVMLKLTLPTEDDFYADLVAHDKVLRVVALSGGYSRDKAVELLSHNPGVIASFSRALSQDLRAGDTDAEFDAKLDEAITAIHAASK